MFRNSIQKAARVHVFWCIFGAITLIKASPITAETAPGKAPISARADSLWTLRGSPAQARACAQAYADAAREHPADRAVWSRLARIRFVLGNYLETDPGRKDQILLAGAEAAKKALDLTPTFHEEFTRTGNEKKAAMKTGIDGIEALFWYGANLGLWASDKNIFTRLANKSKLEAINGRVLELDEKFLFGAPHRFFGVLPTKLPGGDLNESKKHFERALVLEPNCFSTRTLYAEMYAVKAKDKATFLSQLKYVMDTPAGIVPELAPENGYEKLHAQSLLKQTDALFR